ncbi:MAG: mucoidy inhibitor MuiA family protein [Hyphomicrobiaceae bacterium]|nr:mucoidy inhibitor MuiA family protein [Hyphomicrobiaceae bacterium]
MRLVIGAVTMLLTAMPLGAAELPATSKVDAVTVFASGAEVRRLARLRLEAGEHTVIISDLPQQAVANSIRVDGKATGKLEIGAVDSRRIVLPRAGAEAQQSERRRIEDQIERLKDERTGFEGRIEAAESQKVFIKELMELPARPVPAAAAGQTAREDWPQVLTLIGTGIADANRAIQDAEVRIREIDRRIAELEKELAAQAPPLEERTQVKIHLIAPAPLEADLVVRYQVPNASWTPVYDSRLTTGAKNAAPQLTLTRRASITQRTGEAWQDVALTLSTTRPASNVSAPDLKVITVDFMPERPPVAEAPAAARDMARRRSAAETLAGAPPPPAGLVAAGEQKADASLSEFAATFAVPGRVTIENTGEIKRVVIDEAQLEPTLVVRAVPKREERAFLYAKLVLPKASVFLPGPISLFRDQTFVGTGHLPQLAGGDEHELGFGADDAVRIRYTIADEKRGETGLISTSRTDQRNYRITVKNLHERPIAFTVLDQVPASLNQEIKVELIGRAAPTRRDVDDKRGVLAWEDKLAPDEERVIEFGYRITWPAAKNITFRP